MHIFTCKTSHMPIVLLRSLVSCSCCFPFAYNVQLFLSPCGEVCTAALLCVTNGDVSAMLRMGLVSGLAKLPTSISDNRPPGGDSELECSIICRCSCCSSCWPRRSLFCRVCWWRLTPLCVVAAGRCAWEPQSVGSKAPAALIVVTVSSGHTT